MQCNEKLTSPRGAIYYCVRETGHGGQHHAYCNSNVERRSVEHVIWHSPKARGSWDAVGPDVKLSKGRSD